MRYPALFLATFGLLVVATADASAAAPDRTVRLVSGNATLTDIPTGVGMSADGSRALFSTSESLVPEDTNSALDVYARDSNGKVQLIGTGKGAAGSAFAGVSADGNRTWYLTTDKDVAADTDANTDVYEERRDGAIRLISAGNGTFQANFIDASDSGDHVLFSTTEPVPQTGDGDAVLDLYDRRADGTVRLVTPGTALALQTPRGPPRHQRGRSTGHLLHRRQARARRCRQRRRHLSRAHRRRAVRPRHPGRSRHRRRDARLREPRRHADVVHHDGGARPGGQRHRRRRLRAPRERQPSADLERRHQRRGQHRRRARRRQQRGLQHHRAGAAGPGHRQRHRPVRAPRRRDRCGWSRAAPRPTTRRSPARAPTARSRS